MSKRAEEKALEIFPVKKIPHYGLSCNAYSERDANLDNRALFCMGYEQAEKDTIERAVNVLINLPSLVIPSNYIAYFRKKMMEEE